MVSDNDAMESVARRVVSHPLKSAKKNITISSLGLNDFASAREQALKEYKREKITTWTENEDLIPADKRDAWIREAFDRAELLTYTDLPQKVMQIPDYIAPGKPRMKDGKVVLKDTKVEYAMWWMSETPNGRVYMTWLSMKKSPDQQHMSFDDADKLFIEAMDDLEEVAQAIGDISNPRLAKNPPAPQEQEGQKKKERIRKRRRRKRGH
jgi:hypothetical protein